MHARKGRGGSGGGVGGGDRSTAHCCFGGAAASSWGGSTSISALLASAGGGASYLLSAESEEDFRHLRLRNVLPCEWISEVTLRGDDVRACIAASQHSVSPCTGDKRRSDGQRRSTGR